MVRYELKKVINRPLFLLLLLVIFILNTVLVYRTEAPGESYAFAEQEILTLYRALPEEPVLALATLRENEARLQAALQGEEYSLPLLTADLYTELDLFREVIARVEPVAKYSEYLDSVQENAEILIRSQLVGDTDSFGYQNLLRSAQIYSKLEGNPPQIFYSATAERLGKDRTVDVLAILLIMLFSLELMTAEKTAGTLCLVKPTKRGGLPLCFSKLVSMAVLTFFSTLLLYGSALAINALRYGIGDLNAPIQSVYGFQSSPWNIDLYSYYLLFFISKYLWLCAVASFLYFACILSRNAISACITSIVLLLPSFMLSFSGTPLLKALSFFSFGDTSAAFTDLRNLNIFEKPVNSVLISLFATIAVLCLCTALSAFFYKTRSPVKEVASRRKKHRRPPWFHGIFATEAYKLFRMNGGLLILLLFLAVQVQGFARFEVHFNAYDQYYRQYSAVLSGETNEEKDRFLQNEQRHFEEIDEKIAAQWELVATGKQSEEAAEVICGQLSFEKNGELVFEKVQEQYDYMDKIGADYVDLTAYERLLGTEGLYDFCAETLKLFLVLVLGLSASFSLEKETKVDLLLSISVKKGKALFCKLILCGVFCIAAGILAYLPQVLAVNKHYGLSCLSSPAASVPQLGISHGSIGAVLSLYGFGAILLSLLSGSFVLFCSKRLGSTIYAIIVSASVLILPIASLLILYR